MPPRLLLVEDDAELAAMVADFLGGEGYEVHSVADGRLAVDRILSETFDAIVLDIGLPGMDGIAVCRAVRNRFAGPIVVLTARGDEVDEVVALEVGADDYMAKPVRPRALLARLRNQLHRSAAAAASDASAKIEVGGLCVDPASRTVTLDAQSVDLTTAEFDLLYYLAQRAGTVVNRADVYEALHEIPFDGFDRSIDLRVSRLRRKLGDDPNHPSRIKSIRGVGYLLAVDT